jgi:hypothetical protein
LAHDEFFLSSNAQTFLGGFNNFNHLKICKMADGSYAQILFPAGFAGQGVIGKDPTVWLDGARPAKTFILPSFLVNTPAQPHGVTNT